MSIAEFNNLKTKKAKLAFLKEKLATDDRWALRGLVVIYKNQTAEELAVHGTVEANGVGFTGTDASFLTSLAESYRQYRRLTTNQLTALKKLMPKYAGQLLKACRTTAENS